MKAIACQLPAERGVPLSRFSSAEIAREAVARGIVEQVSGATVWRWLAEDAIRPRNYRSWIFPRDPDFREKAAKVLDLYAGRFEGKLLHPGEFVLCADEKPSIQARARLHPTAGPLPGGGGQLVEHEYERMGALCYLAAWDVRRAKLFDRCEHTGGIEPFDRLVAQVMTQEPYASARRVFWIVDTAPPTAANARSTASRATTRISSSSTCPSTPAGSTKSRSTSRSSNARCCSPTTSPTSPPSKSGSSASDDTTSRSPSRSNGSSAATTSTASSNDSIPRAAPPRSPRDGTCERNH